MSLHALLSEFASSVEGGGDNLPERTFVWAIITRALWDSGANPKVIPTYEKREGVRDYNFRSGEPRVTAASIQAEAAEWLRSNSTEELSLRWWLELLNLEHDNVQPKLVAQIGRKSVKKAFTCSSRGPYKKKEK